MRALIVTNMYPDADHPAYGSFVRDQVEALRRVAGVELELFSFAGGSLSAYPRAGVDLRRRFGGTRFDVVHAHFGLTAWPALGARSAVRGVTLHGTDLAHPRSRAITLAALRCYDLVAAVSEPLAQSVPGWAVRRELAVLPVGVATDRFKPIGRAQARSELGLDPDRPLLLFAADPARPEKRYDRARLIAAEIPLLTLGNVPPEEVPLWVNAVNAVLVPSEREGFGLAVLEALACDVPVLATPVGIAPDVLRDVEGTYCGPFEPGAWAAALAPHLTAPDPRIAGRAQAERFSTERMATHLVEAWRALLSA
ncbi:MAG TPA: glycosyltransferase [Solirubrobacteraceae bacterium]|jgi:glycosyltransferase involved in cell wall biosynthesis|nr:glycosyltransferase [Solirubrobacteraceae bacterium]